MGQKVGGGLLCPFPWGSWFAIEHSVASWSIQPFGLNTPTLGLHQTGQTTVR